MDRNRWLSALPQFLVLLPAAASCYFTMKNQMRHTLLKTAALCMAVLLPYSLLGVWLCAVLRIDANTILLPSLVLFFFLYRRTVTASLPKCLAIYVGVCAVQSFPAQFAYSFDAFLHPASGAADFSVEAAFFQLGVSCLVAAAFAWPACHRFFRVVDCLEMQSRQYRTLQEHMRQTDRLRHDFRHFVRLLSSLAEKGDIDGIRAHLAGYEVILAGNAPINYCANTALNALFGYYLEKAVSAGVDTDWHIELQEPLPATELDMASLFGNLMENAIDGCLTLPEGRRYFCLTTEIRHGNRLYIVSTNSFDGKGRTATAPQSTAGLGSGFLPSPQQQKSMEARHRLPTAARSFLWMWC